MTTYIIEHNIKFPKSLSCRLSLSSHVGDRLFVIPACPESPASFLKERFPTSGNDKTCAIIYIAMYRKTEKPYVVCYVGFLPSLYCLESQKITLMIQKEFL
jgi:hypothetical protein